MSAQGTYRFYSVQRQTILLVNGERLRRERVKGDRGTKMELTLNRHQIQTKDYVAVYYMKLLS